jgi:hypothetical protein
MNIENKHNTRCYKCKSNIYALLNSVYGAIEHKFQPTGVSTRLETYQGAKYSALRKVFEALVEFRGYDHFVNAKTLQRCDLFIPSRATVVELDERQHFSEARAVALQNYPSSLDLGFDKSAYIQLCQRLKQKDNDPKYPYRDEQRAWYDTLRDFLPILLPNHVQGPTVRIPIGFHSWCSLISSDAAHVLHFRELTKL